MLFQVCLVALGVTFIFAKPIVPMEHDLRVNQMPLKSHNTFDVPTEGGTGGDGDKTADAVYAGISTFAHLPYAKCWDDKDTTFDIAFLGAPLDTATSYRPGKTDPLNKSDKRFLTHKYSGARFGPSGIRDISRRLTLYGGYNVPLDVNPFRDWAKIVDCGDIFAT